MRFFTIIKYPDHNTRPVTEKFHKVYRYIIYYGSLILLIIFSHFFFNSKRNMKLYFGINFDFYKIILSVFIIYYDLWIYVILVIFYV